MTYVAIIIVLAAVAWKYVPNLYQRLAGPSPAAPPDAAPTATPVPVGETTEATSSREGLLLARLDIYPDGAYVSSVPGSARIYHLPQWGVVETILDNEDARVGMRTASTLKLTPGKHTIAVALRINHGALMDLPGYPEVRRALESPGGEYGGGKQLEDYFVPDGSVATRTAKLDQFRYIARIYEVQVQGNWVAVTALFLPRRPLAELLAHLPNQRAYGYDEAEVERELEFYEVPEDDRRRLMDALSRVGKMCYRAAEDRPYRIFQIDPVSGLLIPEKVGF